MTLSEADALILLNTDVVRDVVFLAAIMFIISCFGILILLKNSLPWLTRTKALFNYK